MRQIGNLRYAWPPSPACQISGLLLAATLLTASAANLPTAKLATHASMIDAELRGKVLPYWFDTA